jgi:acetyl/propionyl-CoA carboxylase alpha subunit
LFLAGGVPLRLAARRAPAGGADPTRHAIEIRLSAEDPATGFAPAPGTVGRWQMPAGPGVRVATALDAGERVPPDYDPLIAKLMVDAADRDTAIARLRRALDEVEVTGIQTTLPFDRALVRNPRFARADLSTDWVTEEWDGVAERARAIELATLVAATADVSTSPATPGPARPGPTTPSGAMPGWAGVARHEAVDRWPS